MDIEGVTRTMEDILRREKRISKPGQLVAYLAELLSESKALIAAALEQLAVDGRAKLEKTGDTYDSVEYIVVSEGLESSEVTSRPLPKKLEWSRRLVSDVNFILAEFRKRADDAGMIACKSCVDLILQIMEEHKRPCDKKRARQINRDLGELHLRWSVNAGGGRFVHYVDQGDRIVTIENRVALQQARTHSIDRRKAATKAEPVKVPVSAPAVEPTVDEVVVSGQSGETPEETIRRLLEIIRQLSEKYRNLKKENELLRQPPLPGELSKEVEEVYEMASAALSE